MAIPRPIIRGLGRRRQEIASVLLGLLAGCLLGLLFMTVVEKIIRGLSTESIPTRESLPSHEMAAGTAKNARAHPKGRTAAKSPWLSSGDTIHTLCTSNGSPYLNFQTRIMYHTYQLATEMPGGEKLVGFTRILHRTQPDILMTSNEVPTFRADPLTPECDTWCQFPVSDRPNAVAQFFKAAENDPSMIKAPWLLMLEGDYVWMKPLQAPKAESSDPSWAFPSGMWKGLLRQSGLNMANIRASGFMAERSIDNSYIAPNAPHLREIIRLMYPEDRGPTSDIPNSGPAPVLMRVQEWIKIMPDWERLTAHIEAHKDTTNALGWVREMYAFSIAAALQGIKLELKPPRESPLMVQPPSDDALGEAALCHYTWGILVEENKNLLWIFDKRKYTAPELELEVPLIPLPPPFREGLKLHEGGPWTPRLHNMTVQMLTQMNKGISRMSVLTRPS